MKFWKLYNSIVLLLIYCVVVCKTIDLPLFNDSNRLPLVDSIINYPKYFYDLVNLYRKNITLNKNSINQLQLIRIPKASSSSLSAIARRMVGCSPPGPCCKYPGDPPGSCPKKELFDCQLQHKVIGCTHHFVNKTALIDPNIITISIMREPMRRAVSAFFYPGIHHNSKCKLSQEECFLEYTNDNRFRNIAVKMFTGVYSYDPLTKTCEKTNPTCSHSLEKAIFNMITNTHFMGIAELWELSLFILHIKFPSFQPELQEFYMGSDSKSSSSSSSERINKNNNYKEFKRNAFSKYFKELSYQNNLDILLYNQAIIKLCDDVWNYDLWKSPIIRKYWKKNSVVNVTRCQE
eukprot:gene12315-16518_t